MIKDRPIVALFDNDGVILDTESQYSVFWGAVGRKYHPEIPNFDHVIKGQTLVYILDTYFPDKDLQKQVVGELYEFEENMEYGYIPGVYDFIQELKEHGVKTVVVTSSDQSKMNHVYRSHPEFKVMFDRILTSEDFKASKPDPYCYLLGAKLFNAPLENCMVFEDSFNGLKAGKAADIFTVGVATTNSRDSIESKSDYVIDDFREFSYSKMMDLLH
ncbi:MAG: HAD family hydrolase [Bacteroidaceae bacterium]|nr:HAD family hydrolase [Bacteroidaceae bacterium]